MVGALRQHARVPARAGATRACAAGAARGLGSGVNRAKEIFVLLGGEMTVTRVTNFDEEAGSGLSFEVPVATHGLVARRTIPEAPNARLVLVRGAAGAGKTVAASQWARAAQSRGTSVVWLRGASVDRARVWEGVCSALTHALAADGVAVCGADQRHPTRLDVLAKRLAGALEHPTVLVIDNFEGLTTSKLDLGLLDLVMQSSLLTLVVSGREMTALDSPLTVAALSTLVVHEHELRFTHDEALELGRGFGGIAEDALEFVLEVTEGWPLAVHSLVACAAREEACEAEPERIQLASIKDSLPAVADALLARATTAAQQRALLAISVCSGASTPTLEALLVDDVTGDHAARALRRDELESALSALVGKGLILREADLALPRYRAHLNVSRAFRARAMQEFTAEQLRQLARAHAADITSTRPLEAVISFAELGDYDAADRVLQDHLSKAAGAPASFKTALRWIPFEEVVHLPTLAGCCLLFTLMDPDSSDAQIHTMIEQLNAALNSRCSESDEAIADKRELAALSFAHRVSGNHEQALALARSFTLGKNEWSREALLEQGESLSFLYSAFGYLGAIHGDLAFANRSYRRALECAEVIEDRPSQARAYYGLGLCAAIAGEMRAAEEFTSQALRSDPDLDEKKLRHRSLEAAPVHALLAAEKGEVERLQDIYDEFWSVRRRLESWPIIVLAESEVRRLRVGDARALNVLVEYGDEPKTVVARTPYLEERVAAQSAKMRMLQGDYAGAQSELERFHSLGPERALAEVRLALLQNAHESARTQLAMISTADMIIRQQCDFLLYSAVVSWHLGDRQQALEEYIRAARKIDRIGAYNRLSLVPYETLFELAETAEVAGEAGLFATVASMPESVRAHGFEPLSPAEQRAIEALAGLASLEQIAGTLFISFNTLKFHLRNIYRKLKVTNREDAVRRAIRMGILPEPQTSEQ